MKKIIFLTILLFSNVAWLANAAALEPAAEQHTSFEDIPKEVRADIMQQALPELVDFLLRRGNNNGAQQEIPNFETTDHLVAISDKYSKVVISIKSEHFDYAQMIIWDLEANALQKVIYVPRWLRKILITPDGESLITVDCEGSVSIWDMNSLGKKYNLGPCCDMRNCLVALNTDGSKLVTTAFDSLKIWEVKTGKEIATVLVPGDRMAYTISFADHVALSPDGTNVAYSCHEIDRLWIVDATNKNRRLFNMIKPLCTEFGPDGQTIRIWHDDKQGWFSCRELEVSKGKLSAQILPCCRRVGNKRIEIKNFSDMHVNIFDDCSGQFLCSLYPYVSAARQMVEPTAVLWRYAVTDNWAVAAVDTGHKICAWDLNKCAQQNNELIQEIGKLSINKILFLRDKVMKAAAKYRRVVLNQNNPNHAETICTYESLPAAIKDRIKDFVKLVDVKAQEKTEK